MSTKSKLHMKREGIVKNICTDRSVIAIKNAVGYVIPGIVWPKKGYSKVEQVKDAIGRLPKPMLKQIETHINMK